MEFHETHSYQTNALVRNSTLDDMTRGRFDGIINLVDYGYQDSDVVMPSNWSYFSAATCYSTNKLKSTLWRFKNAPMSDSMIEAFAALGQIVYSTYQKKMRVFDKTWHNLGQYNREST